MIATTLNLSNKFDDLNKNYFNGELPRPNKFVVKTVSTYLARFRHNGTYRKLYSNSKGWCEITMTDMYSFTKFDYENILIHEMIHMWEWINGYRPGHGATFKSKGKEIMSKSNYVVSRLTNLQKGSVLSSKAIEKNSKKRISDKIVVATFNYVGQERISLINEKAYMSGAFDWVVGKLGKSKGISNFSVVKIDNNLEMFGSMTQNRKNRLTHYPLTPNMKKWIGKNYQAMTR